MDKSSADGMKTADAAVAAVVDGWARADDSVSNVEWVVCNVLEEDRNSRPRARGDHCAASRRWTRPRSTLMRPKLDGPANARRGDLLYVGAEVGISSATRRGKRRGMSTRCRGAAGRGPARRQDRWQSLPSCWVIAKVVQGFGSRGSTHLLTYALIHVGDAREVPFAAQPAASRSVRG